MGLATISFWCFFLCNIAFNTLMVLNSWYVLRVWPQKLQYSLEVIHSSITYQTQNIMTDLLRICLVLSSICWVHFCSGVHRVVLFYTILWKKTQLPFRKIRIQTTGKTNYYHKRSWPSSGESLVIAESLCL